MHCPCNALPTHQCRLLAWRYALPLPTSLVSFPPFQHLLCLPMSSPLVWAYTFPPLNHEYTCSTTQHQGGSSSFLVSAHCTATTWMMHASHASRLAIARLVNPIATSLLPSLFVPCIFSLSMLWEHKSSSFKSADSSFLCQLTSLTPHECFSPVLCPALAMLASLIPYPP